MSLTIISAVVLGGFILFIAYKLLKATMKKSQVLVFLGQVAVAIDELGPEKDGFVRFHGEHWKAISQTAIVPGQKVKITGREGLLLFVKSIDEYNKPTNP
jgi:membrane-bound serine protease (ClpP class)